MAFIALPTCVPRLISRSSASSPPSTSVTDKGCHPSTAAVVSEAVSLDVFATVELVSKAFLLAVVVGLMSFTVSACWRKSCPVAPLLPGHWVQRVSRGKVRTVYSLTQ